MSTTSTKSTVHTAAFLLVCLLITTAACGSDVLLGAEDGGHSDDADVADSGDGDAAPLLDCSQGMLCAQACGTDLGCAVDCEGRVCDSAAAAFTAFRDCALEGCIAQCSDFGSDGCLDCVADACPLQAFNCLGAEC